ncbi:MAG TPA: glycosyltransferase family 9 protein, partial [Rhabdochlamydiaceae bacterium]|nr:glycosyltransferase family 9 protein [Rhabdochlamydiaceae bacterium]
RGDGDGGIMHLAAALDKPQVVLFGGTKIWEWAPLSEKAVCLSDPHNVNFIPEEIIQQALEKIL